jgi:inosine triphosphate pyrophosphatase
MKQKLIISTGSKDKLKEFQAILNGYDLEAIPVETNEIQGNGEEVILEKAKQAYAQIKKPCIVDDTSFGFEEWGGLPGPYIKEFLEKIGCEKLPYLTKNKNATVTCYVALAKSEKDILIFKGEVKGTVAEIKGEEGFGFDKVFIPLGYNKRYSEMTSEEKNKVSHRYKAIRRLKDYLDNN